MKNRMEREDNMSKTFFISDLHFGHKNALAYDNRPFTSIEEHDKILIDNWNSVVNIDDDVWVLGDISWHNATKTIGLLSQLNGGKHLIVGNHDHKLLRNRDVRAQFIDIYDYKELDIGKRDPLVLCHYPIVCFNRHYTGGYHFYGHVHNSYEWNMMENYRRQSEELYLKPCNMINVGVMIPYMQFRPQTFGEIVTNYDIWKVSQFTPNAGAAPSEVSDDRGE